MIRKLILLTTILTLFVSYPDNAQETGDEKLPVMDYSFPKEYEIGGITVSGVEFLDENTLIQHSGLVVGETILVPGERITMAIERLWSLGLFSDVKITKIKTEGEKIFLDIFLGERFRLSRFTFSGVNRSETQDLLEKINIMSGNQVTENMINNATTIIKNHFIEKSFYNVRVDITQKDDPNLPNSLILNAHVTKNKKVRIKDIRFEGNSVFSDNRLRRVMKNTKKRNLNFFKASKYIEDSYDEDKVSLSDFYNENGYRDFKILGDTLYPYETDRLMLIIYIQEGNKYYHRNITWVGNTKFPSELLGASLGIEKGDAYDQKALEDRLFYDPNAVSSIYMDNGYLFSSINPVEVWVENDSIDLEMRVYEGEQATINKVIIRGNTKTNEHVVRREIRTLPGQLFSKTDIIRSVQEVAQLGHFDPEKINPNPLPDPANGTVDLEYNLEERANDQFEISGGWGAGMLIGTVGLRFNNFSIRNVLKLNQWRPVPSGDGQTLSLRAQSNGRYYQAYNITFVEPWFGGKKPNSFSVSGFRSVQSNGQKKGESGRQSLSITGASVGSGRRLSWPDDFFTLYNQVSYQLYDLNNWGRYFLFSEGTSNNLSFTTSLTRHSAGPNPIFPVRGSTFSLSLQITPPYSLFSDKDFTNPEMLDSEKYRWIEYHKWSFKADYYFELAKNLVLNTKAGFGYLGHYNDDIGPSPFEGFDLGGDGMTGYSLYGRETIALRGYENFSLTPIVDGNKAGNLYSKITMELRYPISMNPQATIFGLVFFEAGNAWYRFQDFNPFGMKRSVGVGLRANLPMFGLLGIDWGYGFDEVPGNPDADGGHFHFVIGQQF
ncbi:MAG: outer membrane protein assembly factor BamA [Bacteroidales bacterium]|nr:MAG: outer membrane protein assembly factor BamA [Bacteroidales bacterium]